MNIYEFPLHNGKKMILKNPTVILDSTQDEGVILDMMSNIFYAPCKLTLPCGSEMPYEFVSQTLPANLDGPGLNAWVADRLEEYKQVT